MQPQRNDERIVFSASQFRVYGAGALSMESHEDDKGCPRRYKAHYVDGIREGRKDVLDYGSVIHDALYRMETEDIGPEEALRAAWIPALPAEMFREAVTDMDNYLSRGGPMTRYGTVGTELDLAALLYVDEDFGPVHYRGIIDWLGVDMDAGHVMHLVDYKTNRQSPRREDLEGDIQLKGYTWLVHQHWEQWQSTNRPRVITHLDAIKFRDVETMYSGAELEEWQAWAEAVARKILRDEEGAPQLNPGCAWCPVRADCPVILELPEVGTTLAERKANQTVEEMEEWRSRAAVAAKALKAQIDAVTELLKDAAIESGGQLLVGQSSWQTHQPDVHSIDLARLHDLIGDDFYQIVTASKAGVERYAAMHKDIYGDLMACVDSTPGPLKIRRVKAK